MSNDDEPEYVQKRRGPRAKNISAKIKEDAKINECSYSSGVTMHYTKDFILDSFTEMRIGSKKGSNLYAVSIDGKKFIFAVVDTQWNKNKRSMCFRRI